MSLQPLPPIPRLVAAARLVGADESFASAHAAIRKLTVASAAAIAAEHAEQFRQSCRRTFADAAADARAALCLRPPVPPDAFADENQRARLLSRALMEPPVPFLGDRTPAIPGTAPAALSIEVRVQPPPVEIAEALVSDLRREIDRHPDDAAANTAAVQRFRAEWMRHVKVTIGRVA